jgi:sarcosine oxidase
VKGQVAVVGLGIMGACTLWRLAERGVTAVGFEQFEPGHAQGASHGETRIIRTAYYEGAEYVPLAQAAFGLWRELEAVTKSRLLTMTGALMIGTPTSELVAGALRSVREHSLAHEMLGLEEMRRRYPQHRLRPGEVALHEEDAGVLRPEACVVAAATHARDLGATIRSNTTAPPLDELRSDYDHVVVCAGAWLPKLLPRLRIQVERQVMTWFEPQDGAQFTPERFPAFMRETPEGGERFGIPAVDGGLADRHRPSRPLDQGRGPPQVRSLRRRKPQRTDAEGRQGGRVHVLEHARLPLPGRTGAGPGQCERAGRLFGPRLQVRAGAR